MFIYLILGTVVVMLASLAGVFSLWKGFGKIIEKHLSLLVSLSAGVFLIISLELATEVFEHAGLTEMILWVAVGAAFIWLVFRFIPTFHHHHEESEHFTHLDGRRILIGDAIHNIGDGILLAVSFSINPILGITTTLSVFIHEFVQETSEFFVLRQSGLSTKKALLINFMISGTILIGAIGSYFLLEQFEMLEVPLLGISAGSFFVVVLNDLIPHSIRMSHNKKTYTRHFLFFLIGILIMFSLNKLTPHGHEEESHEYEIEHIETEVIL